MTPVEILNAPRAAPQPQRTERQLRVDDAWHRAAFAPTPELQALWQLRWRDLQAKP